MPETNEQPEDALDEFEKSSRVNFRDYPSSGLVVIAALSSGLGWMLFKWLGKKRKERHATSADDTAKEGPDPQTDLPRDQSS